MRTIFAFLLWTCLAAACGGGTRQERADQEALEQRRQLTFARADSVLRTTPLADVQELSPWAIDVVVRWADSSKAPAVFAAIREESERRAQAAPQPSRQSARGPGGCDRAAARTVMRQMADPAMARVTMEDGWVVVHFGSDWYSWTERRTEGMVTTFANADACLSGRARRIEFRSPTGSLVARADEVRGIHMMW